jgi:hypothetical protein
MGYERVRIGLLVIASLMTTAYARAQGPPDPWYGRQSNPKNIDPPKTFPGMFIIELPKNWQLGPGHTGTIFVSTEKTGRFEAGALITVEYLRLQAALEPALIAGASERELKELQARELSGKGFTGEVKDGPQGKFIVIRYNRPGLSGSDDHVVQYSFPIGTTMYRLICIAPAAELEKYKTIFAHVAASFTPLRRGGTH